MYCLSVHHRASGGEQPVLVLESGSGGAWGGSSASLRICVQNSCWIPEIHRTFISDLSKKASPYYGQDRNQTESTKAVCEKSGQVGTATPPLRGVFIDRAGRTAQCFDPCQSGESSVDSNGRARNRADKTHPRETTMGKDGRIHFCGFPFLCTFEPLYFSSSGPSIPRYGYRYYGYR